MLGIIYDLLPKDTNFYLVMAIISVITQIIATIFGFKLFFLIRKIPVWYSIWFPYIVASFFIIGRRLINLYKYIVYCPINTYGSIFLENFISWIISFLLVIFTIRLNRVLSKYFEDGHVK